MQHKESQFEGNYTVRLARNLIYISYKEAGIEYDIDSFEQSRLSNELGEYPAIWNAGLFRYLDECICLVANAKYLLLFSMVNKKLNSSPSPLILLSQILNNAIAIRVLQNHGLDDQARIALRALYENCIAFCRALVDEEFRENFRLSRTPEETNEFWHKNMSKSKCEKFLIKYNETTSFKCPLVLGDSFNDIRCIVGISSHPNYLYSSMHFTAVWSDVNSLDKLASTHHTASELVLINTCQMVLSVMHFLSYFGEQLGESVSSIIEANPESLLSRSKTVDVALRKNGRIAALMFLMLAKWSNRQKEHFDPEKHF